jgi:hypothetical protein
MQAKIVVSFLSIHLTSCIGGGQFAVSVENDAFAKWGPSDSNYTHGHQLEWTIPLDRSGCLKKLASSGLVRALSLDDNPRGARLHEEFAKGVLGEERLDTDAWRLGDNHSDASRLDDCVYLLALLARIDGEDVTMSIQNGTGVYAYFKKIVDAKAPGRTEELTPSFEEGAEDGTGFPGSAISKPAVVQSIRVRLGQQIYTPDAIEVPTLIEDDRPYAGWLYLSTEYLVKREDARDTVRRDSQTAVGLSLGVVGPASGAGAVQRGFHDWRGFTEPEGWDNQLENEPTIMLTGRRDERFLFHEIGSLELDASADLEGRLGNVHIMGLAGSMVRLGKGLTRDFGPALMPSATGARRENLGAYMFAGVEGRAVARDIFLDGNTFEDSHSVDSEVLVADLKYGFAIRWKGTELSLTFLRRTEEFEGQEGPQNLGAFRLVFSN